MCNKVDNSCRDEKLTCEGCAYCEKSADDLLEKIGIVKEQETEELISYCSRKERFKKIEFNKKIQCVRFEGVNALRVIDAQIILMKMEELGWE